MSKVDSKGLYHIWGTGPNDISSGDNSIKIGNFLRDLSTILYWEPDLMNIPSIFHQINPTEDIEGYNNAIFKVRNHILAPRKNIIFVETVLKYNPDSEYQNSESFVKGFLALHSKGVSRKLHDKIQNHLRDLEVKCL